jgi:hypothetical protein
MKQRMKICRPCRTEIDARASICPACRTKQPNPAKGIALLIIAGIVVIGSIATRNPSPETATAASAPQPVAEKKEPPPPPPTPAIGENVSEPYFDYIEREVGFDCAQQIKQLVKYDIRSPGVLWGTNSGIWALLRFSRWSSRVASDGTIRLSGDEAEAQNGFGNWMRVNYSCTVEVATKTIKRVTLNPGRLG